MLTTAVAAAQIAQTCANSDVQLYTYKIVKEYPHDPDAFTQGLQFERVCGTGSRATCEGVFYESTGLYGESTVRVVDAASGEVVASTRLHRQWFGEGLVKLNDKVYQLTWMTPTVLVYDSHLKLLGERATPLADGWGLTTDGKSLIVSDGSHKLTWLDPDTMQHQKTVEVKDGVQLIHWINELEMVEGEIWANVWQTDCIARIDPDTGRVNGWVLMGGLRTSLMKQNLKQRRPMDVLNGIAYDSANKRLFVTGKLWPRLYEITVEPLTLQVDKERLQDVQKCHIHNPRAYF